MSEYIDKKDVISLIKKHTHEVIKTRRDSHQNDMADAIVMDLYYNIPPVDVIPIPKEATYGDMIKAMFLKKRPNISFNENFGRVWIMENGEDIANFRLDLWNAPYNAKSEE